MSVTYYMDEHIPKAVTLGLRRRAVDVLTAQEDQMDKYPDAELLDRATWLGRILVSQDSDLLQEAHTRHQRSDAFAGVIYAHQLHVTIGQMVNELELISRVCEPSDFASRVEYLPLK